jgi:type II secretory pathway pseudopilin PulG
METRTATPQAPHGAAGFSMIEALIAAAILLIIALGLIPLFSRAITDNTNGNDATQATNGGRTQLEEYLGMPFANAKLTIPAGSTETLTTDSFTLGDPHQVGDAKEGWWPGTPTDKGTILWTRRTRVRQFKFNDLTTPLAGNADPRDIQVKEIEVVMINPKQGGILGSGQGITLRMLKSL